MHPMIRYWQIAFSKWKIEENQYFAPEMPDPILSPHFYNLKTSATNDSSDFRAAGSSLNVIQDLNEPIREFKGFRLRNNFSLCTLDIEAHSELPITYTIQNLKVASQDQNHLALLRDGFPSDFDFLKRLEKFFLSLNATYLVGTIFNSTKIPIASLTVGTSGKISVLVNTTVRSDFRNQKASRHITALARHICQKENSREIFYWTKAEQLIRYAKAVDRYLVYVKSN